MSCACHSSLRRDGGKSFTPEVVIHARHQAALSVKSCAFLRRKFIFQAGTSSSFSRLDLDLQVLDRLPGIDPDGEPG